MGGKGKGGGKGGGDRMGRLLVVGAVLYCVAWFVPVYKGQELFGGLGETVARLGAKPEAMLQGLDGPDWLPGWPACKFAWQMLCGDAAGGDAWKQRLAGSTCLTNAVMALALVLVMARGRSVGLGLAVLACAGVDSCWLWLSDRNPLEWLRAGYFLWLLGFVLVGAGLCAPRRA